ncbi:MAG: hypothetical protein ACKO6N_28710, partial [Myxococcota bacterium]
MNAREWRLTLLLGACSSILSWLFHEHVLGGQLHVQDEINYVWQSRVFELGRLKAPPTAFPDLFTYLFQSSGPDGTYAIFPPGWSLMLGLAAHLHLRELLPMLLGGLCIPAIFAFTQQLLSLPRLKDALSERERQLLPGMTACLLAFSPAHVVMSGTFMAHTFCLLLCLLFLTGGLHLWIRPQAKTAAWVGLLVGWLASTRPVDALAVAGPLLVLLSFLFVYSRKWGALSTLTTGLALPLVALGLYHQALTGSPFTFPQDRYFSEEPPWVVAQNEVLGMDSESDVRYSLTCNKLGFGSDRGCAKTYGTFGHTPEKAVRNILTNAEPFDRQLLGIVGVSLLAPLGWWRL